MIHIDYMQAFGSVIGLVIIGGFLSWAFFDSIAKEKIKTLEKEAFYYEGKRLYGEDRGWNVPVEVVIDEETGEPGIRLKDYPKIILFSHGLGGAKLFRNEYQKPLRILGEKNIRYEMANAIIIAAADLKKLEEWGAVLVWLIDSVMKEKKEDSYQESIPARI